MVDSGEISDHPPLEAFRTGFREGFRAGHSSSFHGERPQHYRPVLKTVQALDDGPFRDGFFTGYDEGLQRGLQDRLEAETYTGGTEHLRSMSTEVAGEAVKVAVFLGQAAVAGVVGNAIYDSVKSTIRAAGRRWAKRREAQPESGLTEQEARDLACVAVMLRWPEESDIRATSVTRTRMPIFPPGVPRPRMLTDDDLRYETSWSVTVRGTAPDGHATYQVVLPPGDAPENATVLIETWSRKLPPLDRRH
ncbi:hypothetical protein [Amycolatopsis speibonae]|uniref:Uncharacterized protein n=1 Tax=Amycolatopsis speibonae TaxID=1450224 RepID=A0ABV7NYY0_9PSEU